MRHFAKSECRGSSGTRPSEGIRRTLSALPRLYDRFAVYLSCLPPNISRELRGSPRRRLGHENRIMPFRLPQNNHATCDHIIGRNSCSRDMTNAGMFLMESSSPCLFSLSTKIPLHSSTPTLPYNYFFAPFAATPNPPTPPLHHFFTHQSYIVHLL